MNRRAPGFNDGSTLVPGCMAFFMSALVTGTASCVNAASLSDIARDFLRAWMVTLPVAIVAAYLTRPAAMRLASILAHYFDRLR
jgi:hypothetical protein